MFGDRAGPPANEPRALPGCFPTGHSAVADKMAQRYWLCVDGVAITDPLPMTTGALDYALPLVGTYTVFSRQRYGRGLHGEVLNHRLLPGRPHALNEGLDPRVKSRGMMSAWI